MPDGTGGEAFARRGAALTWKVADVADAREELPGRLECCFSTKTPPVSSVINQ
jgi:hypothetical protein